MSSCVWCGCVYIVMEGSICSLSMCADICTVITPVYVCKLCMLEVRGGHETFDCHVIVM